MLAAYITFNGNTEDAFEFYKTAFNGTISNLQRFGSSPNGDQLPEEAQKKIMHIALEAPHGVRLMGNDFLSYSGEEFTPGNNFSLSVHPDSDELADQLFNSLSAGGKVVVAMSKAPWGDYFGMFTDKFGMNWMVNHAAKR